MSTRCRTCGKNIYSLNPNNLFKQTDNIMLHQIEAITGLFLLEHAVFPEHICGPCEVALRQAVLFRERIIKTQKLLLNSDSVADAFIEIDFEDAGELYLDDTENPNELFISNEEVIDYEYAEIKTEYDKSENLTDIKHELAIEDNGTADNSENIVDMPLLDETPPLPTLPPQRKAGKPASRLYATVNFATNGKHTPRVNWSKLSEDEIVALKRERRKRDCICELCGRHFTCPSNFKVHLLRHTGVKNFPCKQCPLKFYTPHLLRRHELAHLGEKPYPCQYCGQTFSDHSGRIQHERNRHTNFRPYKCTKCDKAFAVSNKLKRHMLSHSGVRSFHCEVCKVSFMRRPHLAAHYRSKAHEQNAQKTVDVEINQDVDIENEFL